MKRDPIWRRYRDLLRPRPAADVDDEIRFHLEMREREARRAGRSAAEAAADARDRFGDVHSVVAELNDIDRARVTRRERSEWFAHIGHDARFALRSLRRSPGFALTAIATIAVAIAANTVIFSFVDSLLLEPLPYANAPRLVSIDGPIIKSIGEGLALRERASTIIADLGMYRPRSVTLGDVDAVRIDGYGISTNMLSVLGAAPEIGRPFAREAELPGNGREILLGHGLWKRRYGGDRGVIGQRLLVDGESYTVAGVMPAAFRFPAGDAECWVPLTVDRGSTPQMWAIGGNSYVGQLRGIVSASRAQQEITRIAIGMRRLNPMWDPGDGYGKPMTVQPLQRALTGAARAPLLLLLACVGVVLLIACVNVSNLLLSRATARERELSVRAALGGGRARLIRQLLVESVVLALCGGIAGLLLAEVGVRWALVALPPDVPRVGEIVIHLSVLGYTALLTMATGIGFGLLPALRATSTNIRGSGGRFARGVAGGVGHQRVSAMLVVGEVALAVMLAITAGLLVRSFARMRELQPGFETSRLVAVRVSPPPQAYIDRSRTDALYDAILARAGALPGVRGVAAVNRLPIAGPVYGMATRIQDKFEDTRAGLPMVDHAQSVTPSYFATLGIPVLRGRGFGVEDRGGAPLTAIISQSMAEHFWPNEDALGKRIGYPFPSEWLTIVGIVPDVRLDSLRDTTGMAVYMPYAQRATAVRGGAQQEMFVVARTSSDPAQVGQSMRTLVASIDPTVPVSQIRTMDDVIARSIAKPRFTMSLVAGFAATALLLGMIGIYGVMSYVVSQRTREMGVRVALGATSSDIYSLVLGRGAVLAVIGAALGTGAALLAARYLRSFLYGISATDPITYLAVSIVFVAVAVSASFAPARRATAVDAVQALRAE